MILVDFSPVVMAGIYVDMEYISENGDINEHSVRHIVFESIRYINKSHSAKYGTMVICNDTMTNWRKDEWELYKANRKKDRDNNDSMDWDKFYEVLNKIKNEVKNELPYLNLEVEYAEADDIIGAICEYMYQTNPDENVLIYSTDRDFEQLQKFTNVKQWSPRNDGYIKCENPRETLLTKLVKGDSKDGVPNILSDDRSIIDKIRQKPVNKKKLLQPVFDCNSEDEIKELLEEEQWKKFQRNKKLLDLTQIPMHVKNNIITKFNENEILGSMAGMIGFCSNNDLKVLFEKIEDFKPRK